jgi:predicted Fe-S protein YdhL (DUF1289 family)
VFQLSPQELELLTDAPVGDFAVNTDEEKLAQQRAIALVSLRAASLNDAEAVPSPCISICRMNTAGLCEGCFRTRDEIAQWSGAGEEGKRRVWGTVVERMAVLQGGASVGALATVAALTP